MTFDTEKILESMAHDYKEDLEVLFNAILKSKLPSEGWTMGEGNEFNRFKELLKNHSEP